MTRSKRVFDWKFIKRALWLFLPIIASSIINSAVSFVGNIMVNGSSTHDGLGIDGSQVHQIDYKAVGVGNELFFIFSSFGIGTTILFSILYGQFVNKEKKFVDTVKFNFWFILILSILISLIMFFEAGDLVKLFFLGKKGNDADLVQIHAKKFIQILSLGQLFFSLGLNLVNPLIIKGKAKYAMILSIMSMVINTILNGIFIYVFKYGAEGSATATDFAYFSEFIIALILVIKNKKWFKGFLHIFQIDKKIIKETFKRIMIWGIFILMQAGYASTTIIWSALYTSDLIAPMATSYIVVNLLFTMFAATGKGVSIYVGPLLGDGKLEEAKQVAHKLWWPNLFLCLALSAVALIISSFFPQLMLDDDTQIKQSRWIIWAFVFAFPGFTLVTYYSAIFEIGGMQLIPNFWNRSFVIWAEIPLMFMCSPLLWDIDFILSFIISNIIIYIPGVITYILFRRYKWVKQI